MHLNRRSLLKVGGSLAASTAIYPEFSRVSAQDATPAASPVGGSLVVYSGRNEGLVGPLLDQVQSALGIDLKVRYAGTSELAATILEEGDRSPADVFLAQDAGALGAVAKGGVLAALPQTTLDLVNGRFRSRDGFWIGVSARARVLAVNSENVDLATLPNSVEALVDPVWAGKIGWAPTNASFQTFVTAFRLIQGEDAAKTWLEGMIGNGTVGFEGNAEIVTAVAAGEISGGLVNHYYKYELEKESGELPVVNHFFASGDVGSLVNVAGVGILASAANPIQADAFVTYLLGTDAQTYFAGETFEYPLAGDVEPAVDLPSLDDIESPDIDLNDLDDLAGTLELLTTVGLI